MMNIEWFEHSKAIMFTASTDYKVGLVTPVGKVYFVDDILNTSVILHVAW